MKDIVIIANFCRDFSESDNGRFVYLANLLSENNQVEIITSDFYHGAKKKRDQKIAKWPFKITFIEEPGYPTNVCLRRFYSHHVFAKNVGHYLRKRKVPDVVYCAVPSLDVAYEASKYAKSVNAKFIVDIQDLWPEAFRMVFHVPLLSDILFAPMVHKANKIYASADEVVAVSQRYANRGMKVNRRCKEPIVAFLGTKLEKFDLMKEKEPVLAKPEGEIWMGYIGTLGVSYSLIDIMQAMLQLKEEGKARNLRFLVMGQGPLKERFELFAKEHALPVVFLGMLDYPKMVSQLCQCDFVVNPIRGASASIINKVGDYAASGKAVINTQECKEYRALLRNYEAGITCENGDIKQLAEVMNQLYEDEALRMKLGKGNRRLAEEKFDREKTYSAICKVIEEER